MFFGVYIFWLESLVYQGFVEFFNEKINKNKIKKLMQEKFL